MSVYEYNNVRPKLLYSLDLLETVKCENPKYYILSYLWRPLATGEKGWTIHDKLRDKNWHVKSTKYEMILYLKEAFKEVNELDEHMGIWIDALCVCQDDENEKREEIPRSRNYYANAEMCILCPWMGFGISKKDHFKAGTQWSNRSWPVQEIIVSKKVGLLYNNANEGIRWKLDILDKSINIPDDVENVYGSNFVNDLKYLLSKKATKGSLKIEESLRLSYNRVAKFTADLIYAYIGMSNIDQRFGDRENSTIIGALEWLYHSLPKEDRIRILMITAKPMGIAEGASWMPNYTTKNESVELITDCDCVITETIAKIEKYEQGIGITLSDVTVITIITNSPSENNSEVLRYYEPDETRKNELFYKHRMWSEELEKTVGGPTWGIKRDGKYKLAIVGKTEIEGNEYFIGALCVMPHMPNFLRKVGISCVSSKDSILDNYVDKNKHTCIIG